MRRGLVAIFLLAGIVRGHDWFCFQYELPTTCDADSRCYWDGDFVGCTHKTSAAEAVLATKVAETVDDQWKSWLTSPPPEALQVSEQLDSRADQLVSQFIQTPETIAFGDIDVVVSGGGFLDWYYVGIAQVLSRVEAATGGKLLNMHRVAGASAGGMTPFEMALKGQNATIQAHLAYGMLQEHFPSSFSNDALAAYHSDHAWRIMASWQSEQYSKQLPQLDGKVFLALSCLDPLPTLVMVSNYSSASQAEHAFMATGTYAEWYDEMLCSDGGSMSGKKMTPLFQDHARPQLIVDLMASGAPDEMVFRFNVSQAVALCHKGQDDMIEFLKTGKSRGDAISLCPANAKVSSHICESNGAKQPMVEHIAEQQAVTLELGAATSVASRNPLQNTKLQSLRRYMGFAEAEAVDQPAGDCSDLEKFEECAALCREHPPVPFKAFEACLKKCCYSPAMGPVKPSHTPQ